MPVAFGDPVPQKGKLSHAPLPNVAFRQRKRFTMKVHPQNWEWNSERKMWLPDIDKMPHDPGVQGVAEVGPNRIIDTSAAESYYRQRGYRIIHDGDDRLDPPLPDGHYMVRFRARVRDGVTWCYGWAWEGYEILNGVVYWEVDRDLKARVQMALLETGIIDPISDRLRQQQLTKLKRRVSRLEERLANSDSPSLSLRYKATVALLEDWQEEREKNSRPEVVRRRVRSTEPQVTHSAEKAKADKADKEK